MTGLMMMVTIRDWLARRRNMRWRDAAGWLRAALRFCFAALQRFSFYFTPLSQSVLQFGFGSGRSLSGGRSFPSLPTDYPVTPPPGCQLLPSLWVVYLATCTQPFPGLNMNGTF